MDKHLLFAVLHRGLACDLLKNCLLYTSAAGESCSTVKGIPWLIMADGPAGLRLAKEYYEDGKGKHAVGNALRPDSIMEMLSGPMKLVMSLMGGNGKPKDVYKRQVIDKGKQGIGDAVQNTGAGQNNANGSGRDAVADARCV